MKQHTFAKYLLAIAMGHLLFGLLTFWPYLIELPNKGWINSVGPKNIEGAVSIWFLLFTWPLILIVIAFWNQQVKTKKTFLFAGIVGSIFGISLMPQSGFWLLLILCCADLYISRFRLESL